MDKWAICIATVRPEMTERWLHLWESMFTEHNVDVYIIQDADEKTVPPRERVHVFDHSDVKKQFSDNAWIIPRLTAACRSYAMLKAYNVGYDYYVSLDDDCYPLGDLFSAYKAHFSDQLAPHYKYVDYAALFGYKHHVRGYPYGIRKKRPVAAQYGIWTKVPDYDALTAIEHKTDDELELTNTVAVVPKYSAFTGCLMNAAITHKYLPVMYQLLMGKQTGYDRMEDIWSSLVMKRIADHFEDIVVLNGKARVIHDRASDPYKNLSKELPALPYNETLWDRLMKFEPHESTPLECYKEIAEARILPDQSDAMLVWAKLFETST